ncbi:cytochrome P450 [Parathielavia appendiculata]|uniref:Cytochrome P450 n=1 Tax=Parathielavia appendiculata TaxID=2587402 RepID=A0AAN6TRT7_9PEZI|nr:cytochrome P450 [Parathielavia appendiculata]
MFNSLSARFALLGVAVVGFILVLRKLYPKPYPGIPYNEASAKRLTGDILELAPIIQETNEFSEALFTVTTQKLGTPIAQLLFPGIRKPLIILEDAREIEDIIVRRSKEFDRAPMAIDIFGPMFPRASLAQFTTPELKAQKRLWADVMNTEFLRKVAAPNIHKSTCELLELWRLKASTVFKDRAFNVLDDFKNAALDAIWVAVVGEEPGTTRYEIQKLRSQLDGNGTTLDNNNNDNAARPIGSFLKEQVAYLSNTIARNSNSPSPRLAQKLETYTPRYRRFRRTVSGEMRRAMKKAVDRYQSLEVSRLGDDAGIDKCAMDLVLRRQILQAKKAGVAPSDPTQDEAILDEMFVMLVGGHDSTANTLSWFVRYMESHPSVQSELRSILQTSFPTIHLPCLPSASEILSASIPYLDATIEELVRLSGTAKANLRQALVDTHILGCPVPKGAEVFMNYHINRPTPSAAAAAAEKRRGDGRGVGLEGPAGRDLGTFQPRRWIVVDEDGTGRERFDGYALPSLAFGGGFRGCFGRFLISFLHFFCRWVG